MEFKLQFISLPIGLCRFLSMATESDGKNAT